MMCRRVTHEHQVVGTVLVVTGYVQGHHALQKLLAEFVIREQSVTIDVEQLALIGVRTAAVDGLGDCCVET